MSSIEAFRSSINKYTDFARNSRFIVIVPGSPETSEFLALRCEEAELPGRTFSTFEARTYGPFQKYPALTSYNEMNLTILCSGNQVSGNFGSTVNSGLIEKRFFDTWMNYIQNPRSSGGTPDSIYWNFSYKKTYTKDIAILHYDVVGEADRGTARREPGSASNISSKNQISYGVKIINAYPTSINQIALSWGNDEISRLVVTMAYDYWEPTPMFEGVEGTEFLQPPQSNPPPISTQIPRNNQPSNTGSLEANRAELRRLNERAEARNAQTQAPGEGPR